MPTGRLPVFSVDNAEQAEALISLACSTNFDGEYVSRELTKEQTPENLGAFSDRLDELWTTHLERHFLDR